MYSKRVHVVFQTKFIMRVEKKFLTYKYLSWLKSFKHTKVTKRIPFYYYGYYAQSTELTRRPPELVQHFRLQGDSHGRKSAAYTTFLPAFPPVERGGGQHPVILCNGANVLCFMSSLPLLTPSHHSNVSVLPVISLPLTNSVSPVRACPMPNHMMGEVSWDPHRRRSCYAILSGGITGMGKRSIFADLEKDQKSKNTPKKVITWKLFNKVIILEKT